VRNPLLAILLASVALTGCMGAEGSDLDPSVLPGDASAGSPAGAAPPLGTPPPANASGPDPNRLRFAAAEGVHKALDTAGTFQLQDHWFPLNFARWVATRPESSPSQQAFDLTPDLPRDLPLRITADLASSATSGRVFMFLQTPLEEFYSAEVETTDGNVHAEWVIVHRSGDPIRIVVAYGNPEPAPTVTYTLHVELNAWVNALVPAVPAAIALDPGSEVRATFAEPTGDDAVLLWDPADRFIGRFKPEGGVVTHRLAADAPAGEYVLLVAEGSGDAFLAATRAPGSGPAPMRALGQDITFGEARTVQGHQVVEWDFEVARTPIQVGLLLLNGDLLVGHSGSLASPEATLIDFAFAPEDWWLLSNGGWWTPMGSEGLVPGTYHAAFGVDAGANIEVGEAVVHYER
jgi:hypothetical protein